MKKAFLYLFFLLFAAPAALAQDKVKLAFQDSVRVTLENDHGTTDAHAMGAVFATGWHKLDLNQQQAVKDMAKALKKKRYKPFPLFNDFFGSIGFAVEKENLDHDKLNAFLKVAGLVVDNENAAKTAAFFRYCRDFFEYRALHYEKSYRLFASDDEYTFDYLKDPSQEIPSPTDTAKTQDNFKQWDNQNAQQETNNTVWQEDTTKIADSATPSWMLPTPQPVLTGAVLKFTSVTFNFCTPYDSAFIKNTEGSVALSDGTFVGKHGSFGWSPAGLNADSVHFEFGDYNFKVDRPQVKAEQGKILYEGRLKTKVDGIFEFRSVRHKDKLSANYPRFMSYNANIPIEGFSNDKMKYTGGFALNGHRIYSSSVNQDYSKLEVTGAEGRKFTAKSRLFEFQDSVVSSRRAMIMLYQDNDSIFHPSVQLRYDFGKEILTLQREKGQLRDAPFTSTFFNVDFGADLLRWDLKSDSMNLTAMGGGNQAPMIIESVDFYNPDDYRLLGGKGFTFHPLALVVNYAQRNGVRDFYDSDLATQTNKKLEEIRMAMTFLSQKGMINYNASTGFVQVKEKAMHFFDAKKGIADYDNLKIHSITDKVANATVNIPRRRMVVRGVEEVNVSDSLNVILKPDSSTLTILQNRDIKFDGKITAGNFEINGKDFTFKYDSFFISLNHIDSIRFYVNEKNAKGQMTRRRVNNAMVGADSAATAAAGASALVAIKQRAHCLSISLITNRVKSKLPTIRVSMLRRVA
ncbi:MAG: hypothetical protein QM754_19900 [Tepidisphaeraceae bacterium]